MSKPRRAWRRVAIVSAAAVLALLLGLGLLASFAVPIGLGLFKNQIARTSVQLIGLPITFDRAVVRSGPQPSLLATGFVLGPVDQPLLRVERLEVGAELAALFSGQLRLTTFEIAGMVYDADAAPPRVAEDDGDDHSAWQVFAPPQLRLNNATVLGEALHVETLQLATDQESHISMQATWQALPMTLDAHLPALRALDELRWDQARVALKALDSEFYAQASELTESGGILQLRGRADPAFWQQFGFNGGPSSLTLASSVRREQQVITLSELVLSADSDRLQVEHLAIDVGGDRLALRGHVGELSVALAPWQRWVTTESDSEPSVLDQWPLDLELSIDHIDANWHAHDLAVSGASLSMNRRQLRFASDMALAADSQPKGHAQVEATVDLATDCTRLSGMLTAMLQTPWQFTPDLALQQLGQAQTEFDVCVDGIDSMLAQPVLNLELDAMAFTTGGVTYPVDRLAVALSDGRGEATISAELEGQVITASMSTPALPKRFNAGDLPFVLDVDYTQVDSSLNGTVSWDEAGFSLLADWVAAGRGDGELQLAAGVKLDAKQLSIHDLTVDMVGVDFDAQFDAMLTDPPQMNVVVNAALIDKDRLVHYLSRLDQALEEAERQGDAFDWLGADFEFIDQLLAAPLIDFRIAIDKVSGLAVGVSHITAQGRLGAGRVDDAQISANFDNVDVMGTLDADFSGHEEQLAFTVDAQNVDLDAILHRFKVNTDIQIHAPSASLSVHSTGRNLTSLAAHADLTLAIPETSFDIGGGDELWRTLAITDMVLATGVGDPIRIDAQVDIDGAPMTAELLAPSMDELLNKPQDPIALQLTLASDEDQLSAVGRVLRPIHDDRFEADIQLSGTRLDLLDGADDDLQPDLGPYVIAAKVKASPESIELALTEGTIGDSRLRGEVTIDRSTQRQKIDVVVDAERIRLEDLVDMQPDQAESNSQSFGATTIAEQLDLFFNDYLPEIVLESDLSLSLQADEIRANNQLLGSGTAVARLLDRRLHVSTLEIVTPHGDINGTLDLADTTEGASIDLNLDVDGLDLAVIAQRVGQDHEGLGLLFMQADLHGEGEDIAAMRRSLGGRLDLFFWPENVSAGAYDLWVSNLLLAILPVFGKGESTFNCAVARFGIAEGVMNAETLMVDTSKMVVHGRGEIDLADQTLLLGFVPQSKKAAFLSMETPVTIKGPINDFGVSIGPLDMAFSAFRLYYNILYVPYQRMRGRTLPEDGMPVCLQEMQWAEPEDRPKALQHFPRPFADQKATRRSR